MTGTADWAELLQPVARRLLADRPCRDGDLRYGARGSLVVHLTGGAKRGTWHDFETDVSGEFTGACRPDAAPARLRLR